jgi:serine/threonine protein kinase
VVHGDIKPDNILMFESSRWTAKVADFSHSLLDTGEDRFLPGGTETYAAPEWRQKLSSSKLFKTDVYSYGILLGSVMVGTDVVQKYLHHSLHGRTLQERALSLQERKQNDGLKEYIMGLIYDRNDNDLTARRDDITTVDATLSYALQSDPDKRDLERVISELMMYNSPLLVLVDSLTAFEVIIAPRLRPDNFRTLYLPDSTPTL